LITIVATWVLLRCVREWAAVLGSDAACGGCVRRTAA